MQKKTVATSVALVIASTMAAPVVAEDLANNDDKIVVVTANRIQQDISDTLADIEVIDRQDIERLQPRTMVDLLVNVAGVDFVQSGGHGQDSSVFVRGTSSSQVLVLVDGVRVGSATLGNKSISTIPVTQIERIEIVKGPRAAIWGSDAIGGVIQIFTRRYEPGEYRLAVTAGSNGTYEVDTSVGFGNERFVNTITYSSKQSDGFDVRENLEPDEDGYDNDSIAIRGDYALTDASVVDYVIQRDRGEVEFDSSFGGNVSRFKNHFWNLRYTHDAGAWLNQVAIKNSRDRTYSFRSDVPSSATNIFETRRQQLTYLTRSQMSESLSVSGGIDWHEDNIEPTISEFPVEKRDTKSGHLSMNYVSEGLLADVAVRYDDVELVASETTVSVSAGYKFNEQHLLSLNFGEGFKAPTFNDLYFPQDAFAGGNPDLDFEISDNLELLYKGSFDNSRLSVSVYDSDIENLIQWTQDENFFFSPENIGKVDITGIDVSYEIWYGDYSHKITADHITSEDSATGEQLIRRAKEHFGYEFAYTSNVFDWYAQVQYVGERFDTDFATFPATRVSLDSYTRVNVGMSYSLDDSWRLQLKINDLFDEAPTQVFGFKPVEREFYLTVSHNGAF